MATLISNSTSPSTFTLFADLPAELRLKIWQHTLPTNRILKISYSPIHSTYISNTAPPIPFSINHESRSQALLSYTHLQLGPSPKSPSRTTPSSHQCRSPTTQTAIPLIPISFSTQTPDTLYLSIPLAMLQTHLHDLLYNLSTCPHRHSITHLAFDLRVWHELCDNGLLAVLAKMRSLRNVDMVVEFGRNFRGEVGFLEAPEWRGDLRWVAEHAERDVGEERGRGRVHLPEKMLEDEEGRSGEEGGRVQVRCVILTRGGEQA